MKCILASEEYWKYFNTILNTTRKQIGKDQGIKGGIESLFDPCVKFI